MRILIAGHLGQLAADLKTVYSGEELILTEYEDLRLEEAGPVMEFVAAARPDLILNCAAYNRVDDAEDEQEAAFAGNTFAVRNLAVAARSVGARVAHFGTDYVFDGPARTPRTEADLPCPRSVYGVSKLGGELMLAATWEKHCIFRVCGLFGYAGRRDKKSNFVETMITLGRQGKPLKVVADQVLTPTSTSDVACKVKEVLDGGGQGLYHLTAAGECSWYEFTRAIFEVAGMSVEVEPVGSDAYPTRARRPNYSVLDNVRLRAEGYAEMPHWRESLERYIAGRHAAGRD